MTGSIPERSLIIDAYRHLTGAWALELLEVEGIVTWVVCGRCVCERCICGHCCQSYRIIVVDYHFSHISHVAYYQYN